jgi:hypothetical protein
MTIAFTGVSSSSGAPIRTLIFQSCNPEDAILRKAFLASLLLTKTIKEFTF